MSKPFVEPMAVTPPTAKEEQDTENLKQVYVCVQVLEHAEASVFEWDIAGLS